MHRAHNSPFIIHSAQLTMLILLLLATWLYAPALNFGFIWDDPIWLGRLVGKPIATLLRPMPNYQFYRPGTLLYHRLFLTSDDTFAAPLLHAAQIGWHLLNIVLVYALSLRLGLGRWTSMAVGTLVAFYPFSHQAVAWAAAHQPLATALQNGAWLTYAAARRRRMGHLPAGLSLLFFLAALFVHESTVVLAPLPLLIEWMLRQRRTSRNTQVWRTKPFLALTYPLIATGFGLLWLRLPRQAGYTTLAFERSVVLYLLQGFIFPLLGRPDGYASHQIPTQGLLLTLAGLTLGGLIVAAWRTGRTRQALLGLAWAIVGVAPSAIGLQYSYVSLGSRLLYHSSPGVTLLWVCALLPPTDGSLVRRLWRTGGCFLLSLITVQSGLLLAQFQQMYAVGTAHLSELIQTARTGETHMLFVNFPDRYVPKRPPYPLGYWGVTLAPVSVDLGDFPAVAIGQRPHTISRRMPPIDFDARDSGPYQTDMRGEITPPETLYGLARQVGAVYLSHYSLDGTFALEWAGAVTTTPSTPSCKLARFGQTICLQQAQINRQSGRLSLTLTWLSLSSAQPHDTIFAHVGTAYQPPIAQADDDACLGLLPLSVWQPGDTIREQRIILLPEETEPAQYEIRIGIYNRGTGERLPATTSQGEALTDNVVVIGHLPR